MGGVAVVVAVGKTELYTVDGGTVVTVVAQSPNHNRACTFVIGIDIDFHPTHSSLRYTCTCIHPYNSQ
jgi:hypothetical protein